MKQQDKAQLMQDVDRVVRWLQDPRTPDMLRLMRRSGVIVGDRIKVRVNPHRNRSFSKAEAVQHD